MSITSEPLKPPGGQDLPSGEVLPKFMDDKLPARAYFSLAQAAKIASCSPDDLLHFGGRNKIRFGVPVPAGTEVFGVLPSHMHRALDPEEYAKFGGFRDTLESFRSKLEMVFISAADCRSVEYDQVTYQTHFTSGWTFNVQEYPMSQIPASSKERKSKFGFGTTLRRFVIFDNVGLHKLRIHQNNIFVMVFDLERFVKGQQVEPLEDHRGNLSGRMEPRPWEADKLKYLIQASERFFKNAVEGNKDSYPSKDLVMKWLVAKGFSDTLAKHADSIIRPDWAQKRGGRPEKV